jgi:hypothetical protein
VAEGPVGADGVAEALRWPSQGELSSRESGLERIAYVAREADPLDARRKRLQVTALGFEVMREGEAIFDQLRDRWKAQIGPDELERLESHLAALVGASPVRIDTPGWIAHDLDELTPSSMPRT